MANYNLTGQKIKDTYGQLAQVSSSLLVDGLGSTTQISTSSIQSFDTEVSKSAAAAGFSVNTASFVDIYTYSDYVTANDGKVNALIDATSSYLTSLPSGTVSSSAQVDLSLAFGTATSASYASNASTADSARKYLYVTSPRTI